MTPKRRRWCVTSWVRTRYPSVPSVRLSAVKPPRHRRLTPVWWCCRLPLLPRVSRSDPPPGPERGGPLWGGAAALRLRCRLHPEGRHVRPRHTHTHPAVCSASLLMEVSPPPPQLHVRRALQLPGREAAPKGRHHHSLPHPARQVGHGLNPGLGLRQDNTAACFRKFPPGKNWYLVSFECPSRVQASRGNRGCQNNTLMLI